MKLVFLLFTALTFAQKGKDVNIDYMLRAQMYVQSSMIDTTARGGFGQSENTAKRITEKIKFKENGFYLEIDTTKIIRINKKFNGYKFFIVNKTDSIIDLFASDSRLSIIAEVFVDSKWQPIEYFPRSSCGNSYHTVSLKQDEYWEVEVPKFRGKIKARLRYKLLLKRDEYIYSNEIMTSINKKQLSETAHYRKGGLMDPYYE